MSREIRFRIFSKSFKRWLCEDSQYLVMDGSEVKSAPWSTIGFKLPSEDYILQQFTGLKDVSGKDIYEGDIVLIYNPDGNLYEESPFRVYYSEKFAEFSFGGGNSLSFHIQRYCYFKIVGNIFENKELLNV